MVNSQVKKMLALYKVTSIFLRVQEKVIFTRHFISIASKHCAAPQ